METKYEKLAIALSVLLLILVCSTGISVYQKLSSVSEDLVQNKPRERRLGILRELNTDLLSAESDAFSFSFRHEQASMEEFYRLQIRSGQKLKSLRRVESKDPNYTQKIDTLTSIVDQRFATMEAMVLLQNENRVNAAMEQVMHEVKFIAKMKPRRQKEPEQSAPVEEKRKWYERRQKEKIVAPPTPIVHPGVSVNTTMINQGLVEIQNDVVTQEQRHNVLKLSLEQKNNRLTARFTQLVQKIENDEKKEIVAEANAAKVAAKESNIIIAVFCITSVLLICIASYLIITLVRKTKTTNRQLSIARDRSEQLTESKSRFLANMSHEIRTPLNAIVGFADQLKETALEKNQEAKLEIIRKAAEHLTQITNEILDFSKINAGAIQLEEVPFSIREEVEFARQSVMELAEANNNSFKVRLDAELPDHVLGDPLRVRQILLNLLSNAMKFTSNGRVTLSVKTTLQSNEQTTIVFTVADTGIGISKENLARIFDEFEQAETSTTRNYGGTGLGLSITKMLVDRMGGQLIVQSELDKGTTFKVALPMIIDSEKTAALAVKAEEAADLSFLNGKRILVVDDEAYNRKLLRNILQKFDVFITEAEDGQEALNAIKESDYDLVLLDLRMPKMDGFRTRDAILKLGSAKAGVPIVALTAALSHEERMAMLNNNWQGVMLKPLKLRELADCLRPLFLEKATRQAAPAAAPKKKAAPAPVSDNAISLEPLREISGDDAVFYLDMLKTLHRTTHDGLQAINQTSQLKDWEGMAEAAHKIASPVKHIQANYAYELLKELERAGRSKKIEATVLQQIRQLNDSIESILQRINQEIAAVE